MYQLTPHTADLGLLVTAPDLETLFSEAGRGLLAMLVENPDDVTPSDSTRFTLAGVDPAYLMLDWLTELLFAFERRKLLLREFDVRITDAGLEAVARGEPVDRARHRLDHEVKAITYHGLRVEQTNDGWVAEVIVDI